MLWRASLHQTVDFSPPQVSTRAYASGTHTPVNSYDNYCIQSRRRVSSTRAAKTAPSYATSNGRRMVPTWPHAAMTARYAYGPQWTLKPFESLPKPSIAMEHCVWPFRPNGKHSLLGMKFSPQNNDFQCLKQLSFFKK